MKHLLLCYIARVNSNFQGQVLLTFNGDYNPRQLGDLIHKSSREAKAVFVASAEERFDLPSAYIEAIEMTFSLLATVYDNLNNACYLATFLVFGQGVIQGECSQVFFLPFNSFGDLSKSFNQQQLSLRDDWLKRCNIPPCDHPYYSLMPTNLVYCGEDDV